VTETTSATPPGAPTWYMLSSDEVAARLGVDLGYGLSSAEAASRLKSNGPNELPVEKPVPGWRRLLDQYRSYMQVILVAAAALSLVIGQYTTALAVFLITVVNAVVGLRQQGKADSAMNALKSMMQESARVRRDGTEASIPSQQVVVGDVVLLTAGDEVPADGRIIDAMSLQIDESALTGESTAAAKDATTLTRSGVSVGDQSNMAFSSTPVTHGSAAMVVTGTGGDTQVGKIAGMLAAKPAEKTPLMAQLDTLTLWIAGAAGITLVIMFALGLSRGQSLTVVFTTAVALAIAAIPEAMPTILQAILSAGSTQLAKHNAVLKDLGSVETLGSTSAINSDKTGTLTMNQVTAVEVVDPTDRFTISGIGYGLDGSVTHAAGSGNLIDDAIVPFIIANDAKLVDGKVVGDPTEGALLILGHKAGLDVAATQARHPRLATLPFDPTYKLMATFHRLTDASGRAVVRCYVKGAAPAVIARAATALSAGAGVPWDDDLKHHADANIERMGESGLRVMAAAVKDVAPDTFDPDGDLLGLVKDLQMTSLVGMIDPPRDESKVAVGDALSANIQVRMVTGDDVVTGAAIAKQLGIPGEAILGADFAALSEDEQLRRIDSIGVIGRVAPEHKVLIVQTLQKKNNVVAMTGDGVNDAPAIKAADIGIAMGSGTEVAKNTGRMILTDDNFATIVRAVHVGRALYDDLLKYIRFMLTVLVAYVVTFLIASVFNIAAGQPLSAVQILWINFAVTAPIGVTLGMDKEEPGLMLRRPRPRDTVIMTPAVMITVGLTGLFIAGCLDALVAYGHSEYGSYSIGSTMALTSFALLLFVAAYQSRSQTASTLRQSTFDNPRLNLVVALELFVAILATRGGALSSLLGTERLTSTQWFLALAPAALLFILWELGKLIARNRGKRPTSAEIASPAPAGTP
jgi:P-type Ca2+ transporter type 2C